MTRAGLLSSALLLGAACQGVPDYDYSNFLADPPRSILVLPPLDETIEVGACYGCLSTLTQPIAEQGFYVFPVAVVDALMRENGLPTSFEMHQVPLVKLREIFDPDAVLYLTVTDWGTSYQVLNSVTTVSISGRLIDAETGVELWSGARTAAVDSGGGGGGLIGMATAALVNQVVTSISDPSVDVSSRAASVLFRTEGHGLLPGPYDPEHEARLQEARTELADPQ